MTHLRNSRGSIARAGLTLLAAVSCAGWLGMMPAAAGQAQCVDYSNDKTGCQPSTFDTPLGQMPSVRVNAKGDVDPMSSEPDARAGATLLEKKLHLFRNFEHLHWVMTVPSSKDPGTAAWRGGDLDGAGDARGLGIAGSCLYLGHSNGPGVKHAINIFRIQPNPEKNPPVQVGEIPAFEVGNEGFDDREIRAILFANSRQQDRLIVVRNGGTNSEGWLRVYRADPQTCLIIETSAIHDFHASSHEFFLWHDPRNVNRLLVFMAMFEGGGTPDLEHPGLKQPDAQVFAVTDENTGEMLPKPWLIAGFSLEEVGGPPLNERRDPSGLFADGRFADFSQLKTAFGGAGNNTVRQNNALHSLSISEDGERVYVAGGTAGFYVLNSAGVARSTNAAIAAATAGCNPRSTIASAGGAIDASKLAQIANDCVHMVVNDDPGMKAFLASTASPAAKVSRYVTLMTRSRFDMHPPLNTTTGTHSAVFVPGRPAQVAGNTAGRPAFVWVSDENGGCPLMYARMMSVESEATPMMIGAFAIPDNELNECLSQATTEPGITQQRRRVPQQNHNPTVFKNLVFTTWYGHGLRAIDISLPQMPREVGYAMPIPQGVARTYPVFKDGLIYWGDNNTGLHVGRYTGPRADELPGPGSGTYEGNATSPHR